MNGENENPSPVNDVNRCPKCQAPLPADAPQGLCAKCLLEAASTPTEAGQGKNVPVDIEVVRRAFPNLEIFDVQGAGGMGVVYKARQPKLDRLVALKLLSQSLASDPTFAERFSREARVLARLNHPNIVTVYDYGEAGGFYYLLMEYVDGINLRQALQGGRFTPPQALALVPKICEALQYAHEEGILHRDIKPENILLDMKGRLKIADFGIAKLLGEKVKETTLTASGAAIGTPQYMAPEQLEHRPDIDQRADIYSFGVVFYEMLTGELPIGRFAPPSAKTPMDPRVDEVVLRALEKEREKRFGSAGEVKTKVEQITGAGEGQGGAQPGEKNWGQAVPAPEPEKRARCYFSTPERMRNCFSWLGANIFICQGELRLEADQLTFVSPWGLLEKIPLKDIEDLSIGQFRMWDTRWIMKYEQVNYLAVTFRKGGGSRTYHLMPITPRLGSIAQDVNEWFEAIQRAIVRVTGAAPHTSEPGAVSVSGQGAWSKTMQPALIGLGIVWVAMLFVPQRSLAHSIIMSLFSCLVLLNGWFAAIFIRANNALKRGDLDAVTLERPPDEPGAQGPGGTAVMPPAGGGGAGKSGGGWRFFSWIGIGLLGLFLLCGLGLLIPAMFWHRSSHKKAVMVRSAELVLEPSRVKEQDRFPGLQVFRWKYSIPANHVALFTCYIMSNGVPTMSEGLSSWYAARRDKTAEGAIQWACQQGVMLSPELRGQERWDRKIEAIEVRGVSSVSGSVWTRGALGGMIRGRGNNRTHVQPGGTVELLAFGPSNVVMQVSLERVPEGLSTGSGCGSDGTNWLYYLKRYEKSINAKDERLRD